MAGNALDVIRELYKTIIADDRTAHDALLADDCTLYEPDSHPVSERLGVSHWNGIEQSAEVISMVKEYWQLTKLNVHHLLSDGDERVVCLCDFEGIGKNGEAFRMDLAEAFRVVDGKVTEIRPFYWDMVRMRKIAGLD